MIDNLQMALRNLSRRRVRTALTILGIMIGIAAVVGLISISAGLEESVKTEFMKLGSDRINIFPGGSVAGPMSAGLTTAQLTKDDIDEIKKVKEVKHAFGVIIEGFPTIFKGESKQTIIAGTPIDEDTTKYIEKTDFYSVDKGRRLDKGDTYKATIGYDLGENFFKKSIKVGNKIEIKGQTFEVVGIQTKSGTGQMDRIVRIPMPITRELFNEPEKVDTIIAIAKPTFEPVLVAEKIKKKLRNFRNVKEGKEDFKVETAEQTIQAFSTILNIIQLVLLSIAGISLIVGGIGIMNTMYTSVLQRTNEIGVMKAIGAQNKDIFSMFMIESGLLGLVAGVCGVLAGAGLSKSIEIIAKIGMGTELLKAHYSPTLIIGAITFSFVLGALSGTLPALQASKLKPAETLRYE